MAWREFQNQMDAQPGPKILTAKPENCIPLAAHLTEKLWQATLKTAQTETNFGFIWTLQASSIPSPLGKSAGLLALAQTFIPISAGFKDPSTQTLIICGEGETRYDLPKNTLHFSIESLLQCATKSHYNPHEAKGELASHLFETIAKAFFPQKPQKNQLKNNHLNESWFRKLIPAQIVGNAMGAAAEEHYRKSPDSSQKNPSYLTVFPAAAKYGPLEKDIKRAFLTAHRAFRLLKPHYSKKIQEFLN